ncbi:MAG TPA: prephenate dehydrogenase/arogenate dehydrogenase family protein [Thermoplasmata archaeon]|nr:prephenate dehydrogenase/arogenate dehydrogenase family protein [Thermoplasmata archaeon]
MSDPEPSLERLREEIAEVDREIASAVARRLALARRVGEEKVRRRQSTRDFGTEGIVLDRWRRGLAGAGIGPERSDALARWMIEESVRVQDEGRAEGPRTPNERADIAIVGGAGAMGTWLAGFFEDAGHRVAVVDPRAPQGGHPILPDVETAAERVDVLVFATPIRATAPLVRRALATGTRALLFDVLSVKAPLTGILSDAAASGRRVTSLHPMFGPSARTLSGRNLLIVSCGNPEADRAARALFEGSALTITDVPIERHDLLIAESLGLAHAVNLLFLAALSADPASPHELARAASTTFHRQSSLAGAVASEGAELYLDIQALNPHSGGLYQELRTALDRLGTIVERQDLAAFEELLRGGRAKIEAGTAPMRA